MTAPAGILLSSVTGGGDCLTLPLEVKLGVSSFSLSAVPGGVGSSDGWNAFVLSDVVRLCRVRYEVDRGRSGRCVSVGIFGDWSVEEDRRLRAGEEVVEEAGDRWEGGV